MLDQFARTSLIFGRAAIDALATSRVAIFGIGGVGGYTAEALVRSGLGEIDLIDDDRVCLTNLNRQLFATRSTIGKYKVEAARDRLLDINPKCKVNIYQLFYMPESENTYDMHGCDYVVDAIDTVTGKLRIIENANRLAIPVISAMGAGNKKEPTMLEVSDIYKTSVCPLARVMRRECRARGIQSLKVVYSKEQPMRPIEDASISCRNHCVCPPGTERKCTDRRDIPGSNAFVPPVAGLIIASEVIKDLIHIKGADIESNKAINADENQGGCL